MGETRGLVGDLTLVTPALSESSPAPRNASRPFRFENIVVERDCSCCYPSALRTLVQVVVGEEAAL